MFAAAALALTLIWDPVLEAPAEIASSSGAKAATSDPRLAQHQKPPTIPDSWIGRRFVAADEDYKGEDAVVRERDLPKPYRVFRPGRRLGDLSFQPDRINIFLDDNSIIVDVTRG